jgi:hypothetical protein
MLKLGEKKMTEKKYTQSYNELMQQLKEQIDFLISSSKSFDKGNEAESKRLANHIRTLLHDTKNSKSLLGQLKKKDKMLYYDTAWKFDPKNLAPSSCCLCSLTLQGSNLYYIPRNLGDVSQNRKIIFCDWWEKQVVIGDKHHSNFTRSDLVRFVADQDGGCHVDPVLDKKYAELSRFNSMGWERIKDKSDAAKNRVVLSCIRQITHEVVKSLADEFPELLIKIPEYSSKESFDAMRLHTQLHTQLK